MHAVFDHNSSHTLSKEKLKKTTQTFSITLKQERKKEFKIFGAECF